jgi:hypothetical protein
MKYHVSFELPDLPGGRMYHSVDSVEASGPLVAANRAFAIVKKRPAMAGRKVGKRIKITIVQIEEGGTPSGE